LNKRRILLLCEQHLLGESLQQVLRAIEDVDMIGSLVLDDQVLSRLAAHKPDLLIIADEQPSRAQAAHLTGLILEAFPDLPVIWVTLDNNILHIYTARTLPARSADLIDVIRQLPPIQESDGGTDHPVFGKGA
jgi:DNA-binding NarL/FixJ family response regulator